MEIISLVLEGKLEHRDNLGNREIIGPYELQRITAGTGILHSETNPAAEDVHFLQIWILPERQGLEAGYEIRKFPLRAKNQLTLLASPDGRQNSARIRQDALLYYGLLESGKSMQHRLAKDRHAWLQIIGGALECSGISLQGGDGAAVSDEDSLILLGERETEFLLFDLN
jgi:hypothetical protein